VQKFSEIQEFIILSTFTSTAKTTKNIVPVESRVIVSACCDCNSTFSLPASNLFLQASYSFASTGLEFSFARLELIFQIAICRVRAPTLDISL